ncbi:MAG: peptidylprolyl isomerase [Crocinitomicaceae bacterium]|nr:peptidylprolyl isomerase [Crocinitomicaceae bacterium]
MKAAKHTVVSLDYTLKNNAGQVMDSSEGQEPLVYLHGVGFLIPGLEQEIEGMEKGQAKSVTVQPEHAYGLRRDDLLYVVPKSGFQGEEEMVVGMQVELDTENGPALAYIEKIDGDNVTLDLNHPLAGEVLTFDIKISDVREASADEIDHGHVHGPHGHHHH